MKSDSYKRARASDMAKVVLARMYNTEYEALYKLILKEEFGIVSTQSARIKVGKPEKYLHKIMKVKKKG